MRGYIKELGWWPNKTLKVIKCPVMAHTLEITFDNLVDFNTKFAMLKKAHLMRDEFNVTQGDVVFNYKQIRTNSEIFNHSLRSLNQ